MARRKKNHLLIEKLKVSDIGAEGKALGRWENRVVFLPLACPGDVVDVRVTRQHRNYLEGIPVHFHRYSKDRTEPVCSHFGKCGGCKWQHLSYPMQLKYKQKQVVDQLERIGKLPLPRIRKIMASPETTYYRNKLEFTFSNNRWLTPEEMEGKKEVKEKNALGFHIPGKFDKVLDIEKCYLQPEPSNTIRLAVKQFALEKGYSFFDLKSQEGLLRNLIIRTSGIGEIMIIVVFAADDPGKREELLHYLWSEFPALTSLYYIINRKKNDSILDQEAIHYKGREYIVEQMGDLKFKIGAKSFYQTNSRQAQAMYELIAEWSGLKGNEVVYDLYTGTGTIAIFLAGKARRVVGIESVPEAIEDAWENARLNGMEHVHFATGDNKDVLNPAFIDRHGQPHLVVLDPPRVGIHQRVTNTLLTLLPERIIYVSCNPATQARDLNLMSHRYRITRVQPIDMFPHTHHVENVVMMERV